MGGRIRGLERIRRLAKVRRKRKMKARIRTAHLKPTRGKSRWSIRGKMIPGRWSAWVLYAQSLIYRVRIVRECEHTSY